MANPYDPFTKLQFGSRPGFVCLYCRYKDWQSPSLARCLPFCTDGCYNGYKLRQNLELELLLRDMMRP